MTLWLTCLSLFAITLPLLANGSFGIHLFDGKRIAIVSMLSLALLAISYRDKLLLAPKAALYCLALISSLTISSLLASDGMMAGLESGMLVGIAMASLLFSQYHHAAPFVLRLAAATVTIYLISVIAHLGNSYLLELSQQVVARLPGFSNIREVSHWLTWTLPLIGALPFYRRYFANIPSYWLWAIAIGWWFIFYISAGRGTAVATICASAVILFLYRQRAFAWLKVFLSAAVIGNLFGIAWIALEAQHAPSALHSDGGLLSGKTSDRFTLWTETWRMFQDHPWFGVGPMHYAHHTETAFGSPHNSVLLLLAETGIVSSMVLFSGIGWLYLRLFKAIRLQPHNDLLIGYSTALVAAGIHSLFSGIQLAPYSQLWMVLIIGAGIHLVRQEPAVTIKADRYQLNMQRMLALSVLCILITGVAYTIINKNLPDPWAEIIGMRYPRFWSHGQF